MLTRDGGGHAGKLRGAAILPTAHRRAHREAPLVVERPYNAPFYIERPYNTPFYIARPDDTPFI